MHKMANILDSTGREEQRKKLQRTNAGHSIGKVCKQITTGQVRMGETKVFRDIIICHV